MDLDVWLGVLESSSLKVLYFIVMRSGSQIFQGIFLKIALLLNNSDGERTTTKTNMKEGSFWIFFVATYFCQII
jgi:dolichyl-phosphate-mannose--protein O-mannosyl transferase